MSKTGSLPVDRASERLRQQWRAGQAPKLDTFLAEAGPLDSAAMAAVLRVDQAEQWAAGNPVAAEEYFRRYPQAAADAEDALDLIYNEYLLAERTGSPAELEAFLRRFPDHDETLRLQIDLHRAVSSKDTHLGSGESDVAPLLSTHPQAAQPIGTPGTFGGRYRIQGTLGQGGMGTVYLAHDAKLNRRVALKVPRFTPGNAEQIERFLREAQIAGGFHHPNLCPVYDVGTAVGEHYITMPVIAGESLAARIKRVGRLPAAQAVPWIVTIAQAVEVAHAAGVVHRDLKPANIMLDEQDEPIVMDFGLARSGSTEGTLTDSGVFIGTPAYAAPEQVGGAEASAAVDVYALGAILYQCLTGRPPFIGRGQDVLREKLVDDPVAPSSRVEGVTASLNAVCLKALARDPDERFPSMKEFAEALDNCELSQARKQPNRRRALAIASIALIGLTAIGFTIWPKPKPKPIEPAVDLLPVDSVWVGECSFTPDDPKSWDPALLWVTRREGTSFQGQAETRDGDYAWNVEGTLEGDRIQWKYVAIIREKMPTNSVKNGANAKGSCDGKTIEVKYHDPGDSSRAVIKLRPVERDSRAAQARVDRAWGYNDKDKLETVIQICTLALKLDDRCVNALICRSNAYIKKAAFPQAIADLDRAIDIDPNNFMYFVDRAWARNAAGEHDQALMDANQAVALKPENSEPYYQRGTAYAGKLNYAKAIEDFTTAIDNKPDYKYALIERGKLYKITGKPELANMDFEKARKLDKNLQIPD